ncbi:MAG: Dabb family protein [Verrucomicrobiales bacterium]
MLNHIVFFWLKDGLSEREIASFREGLQSLKDIPEVRAIQVGTPAATPARPAVDASYDYGLYVALDSVEAHDHYQAHPLHLAFLEAHKQKWTKVQVYDFA